MYEIMLIYLIMSMIKIKLKAEKKKSVMQICVLIPGSDGYVVQIFLSYDDTQLIYYV